VFLTTRGQKFAIFVFKFHTIHQPAPKRIARPGKMRCPQLSRPPATLTHSTLPPHLPLSSGTTVTGSTVTRVNGASASSSPEHFPTTVRSCPNDTAHRALALQPPSLTVPRTHCPLLLSPAPAAPCPFSCPGRPHRYVACVRAASPIRGAAPIHFPPPLPAASTSEPTCTEIPPSHVPKLMTFEAPRHGRALV
jgi:hypothetical protein